MDGAGNKFHDFGTLGNAALDAASMALSSNQFSRLGNHVVANNMNLVILRVKAASNTAPLVSYRGSCALSAAIHPTDHALDLTYQSDTIPMTRIQL